MDKFMHPRVVVGVDDSLSGLAAIRAAVAEARRRGLPLLGVRSCTTGISYLDATVMTTSFIEALGAIPTDIGVELRVSTLPIREALCSAAADPRDLIVVGTSGRGCASGIRCRRSSSGDRVLRLTKVRHLIRDTEPFDAAAGRRRR